MALAAITASLTSQAPAPNPQDLSAYAMVCGPSSAGPLNVPTRLQSLADCIPFGEGPGIQEASELLQSGGSPVYYTRTVATTAGTVGTVAKVGGASDTLEVFGAINLAGADTNGDVFFQSKVAGVTLTVVVGGAVAYAAVGTAVTLTVTNATTGTTLAGTALGAAAALLETPVAQGTGASICGQTLATTAFDVGSVLYTGLAAAATCYKVPGADANGGVIYRSTKEGVAVQQIVSGNSTPLGVYQDGNKLLVALKTDGAGAVLSTAADVAAAIAGTYAFVTPEEAAAWKAYATALGITAQATGTGLGLCAAIALTTLTAPTIAHVASGNATPLSVALTGSAVVVNNATDVDGTSTTTGTLALAALLASADASYVLTPALAGAGSGRIGIKAAQTFAFGSAGTLALSGTPNDGYDIRIRIVRAGTPGGTPAPTMQWAADILAGTSQTPSWSSETLIPAGGVVVLRNAALDTGLTATFSGAQAQGESYEAFTTAPETGITDLLVGVDAAIAKTDQAWGFLTSPSYLSRASATLVDAKLQAAFNAGKRFIQGMFNASQRGVSETLVAWEDRLIADYQGFVSNHGFVTVLSGDILHSSPLTLRQYKRPAVFAAAGRKASIPIHEDLGKTGSGPLARVLYIYQDEFLSTALSAQRFVCTRTYPQRPGSYYLTKASTMADPSAPADRGYQLYERVSIALAIARIASSAVFDYLLDSLAGQERADVATGAVAGALAAGDAADIQQAANGPVQSFVYKAKTDGKASASPLPAGESMVTVRRDNNFLNDDTINLDIKYIPLGLAEFINLAVVVTIPG